MKIKFNPVLPILAIVFAATMGILFYISKQKGVKVDDNMFFVVPMVIILSLPRLFFNYLEISEREILVRSQLGTVAQRYAINGWNDIDFVDNRIFIHKANGNSVEVKFKKRLASKKGLNELNAKLNHLV